MESGIGRIGVGTMLVVAGAVVGAGAALLLAPRSGKETRKGIGRLVRKTRRMAESAVGDAAERVGRERDRLARLVS